MYKYINVNCLFLLCLVIYNANGQGTYKAAVVEYAPKDDAPQSLHRILKNLESYVYYMEIAADKNAQIIVFPEDGLTGLDGIDHNSVNELSTAIPDPIFDNISPCRTPHSNYSKYLIDLSCAASTHGLVTVVNLIERSYDDSNKTIYHNTNVVFNELGVVIAKYRKMHLFNEPTVVPGNKLVTFKTNFGVTFGMFICFDLLFKNPAVDILRNSSITDVIYSAASFSALPFYSTLSMQHGYAKANGVNLLASGLNDPLHRIGGSGIYLYDGTIVETYISGVKGTKIIIADVPKVLPDTVRDTCQIRQEFQRGISIPGLPGGKLPDSTNLGTAQENMSNYTFKTLNMNKEVISEQICSGSSDFCCSFNITIKRNASVPLNYVYKLVAYYGVSEIASNRSLGLRNCALVACTNETNTSCGTRHKEAPQGIIFESISVKGTYNPNTTFPQPATVTHKLEPLTEYSFCKNAVNGHMMEIQMKTTAQESSLLTFGILGRVFAKDDTPGGPINSAANFETNIYLTLLISIAIFLLQE